MKLYTIFVNGLRYETRASSARVAIGKTLRGATDPDLAEANIGVGDVFDIRYVYRFVADVPCLPAGSTKREFVGDLMQTKAEAIAALPQFCVAHPDYQFVKYVRTEFSLTRKK